MEEKCKELLKKFPPALAENKHKGQAGRIGIIGGSLEYTGAPYFAGISAFKCGADLVYIFCMKDAATPIKSYSPELIVFPFLDAEHSRTLTTSRLLNLHSLVIGPGLGEYVNVHSLIVYVINHVKEKLSCKISLIFDADGIGFIAENKDILKNYTGTVYVTPNINEIKKLSLAYLGRRDIDITDYEVLKKLVTSIGPNVTMIMKGRTDKIVTANEVYENSIAGSLRRCGGQGDLVSGALGLFSFWATLFKDNEQCTIPPEVLACYAASSIARTCSRFAFEKNGRSMVTSDMIEQIGQAYRFIFDVI